MGRDVLKRIAVTSDNHIDVNRLEVSQVIEAQADYLRRQRIDDYVLAGDTFNDFNKTKQFVARLQETVGTKIRIYFIAGNHEMVNGLDYSALQDSITPAYLHRKFVDIPGTNYRMIGNNGWYDFSFALPGTQKSVADFARWRNAYWIDGGIPNRGNDLQMMQDVLNDVHQQFSRAREAGKRILFVTHFVPQQSYIFYSLDRKYRKYWNMAVTLMGSQHLGNLIQAYQVMHVFFGHLHTRQKPKTIQGVTYHTAPVGYGLKRINEWSSSNFLEEWRKTLQIIQI